MFRISGPGLMVLVTAFIVAVIFAANQNDVVGWVVAVIAGFWLALAAFVVFSIQTNHLHAIRVRHTSMGGEATPIDREAFDASRSNRARGYDDSVGGAGA